VREIEGGRKREREEEERKTERDIERVCEKEFMSLCV